MKNTIKGAILIVIGLVVLVYGLIPNLTRCSDIEQPIGYSCSPSLYYSVASYAIIGIGVIILIAGCAFVLKGRKARR
jgi:hypothetical protein